LEWVKVTPYANNLINASPALRKISAADWGWKMFLSGGSFWFPFRFDGGLNENKARADVSCRKASRSSLTNFPLGEIT